MTGTRPLASDITLGVLAGGRASRLGGRDKAWLERGGIPQVVRLARRFAGDVGTTLVSANADLSRYAEQRLEVVVDRTTDAGPLGGLDALAHACTTRWLLTLPVDIVAVNDCLLPSLAAAGRPGAYAVDDAGVQPLVALWWVAPLRVELERALATRDWAVRSLQARLGMAAVHVPGVRFGNLNTPDDLEAAGMDAVSAPIAAELPERPRP